MQLLGIEMTLEEFDNFICEQNNGKELLVENGKVVAREHIATDKELAQQNLALIERWFDYYDNQVKQYQRCVRLGIEYDKDINELDKQAKENAERITELRKIIGGENAN